MRLWISCPGVLGSAVISGVLKRVAVQDLPASPVPYEEAHSYQQRQHYDYNVCEHHKPHVRYFSTVVNARRGARVRW
jgi:hypothetical protein